MKVENFLKERKSVREFKDGELNAKDLKAVQAFIDAANAETPEGVAYRLFENGKLLADKLQGLGGYAGVMIKAPHYIVMGFKDNNPLTLLYGAYGMEKMITDLSDEDVASCWVSVGQLPQEIKDELFGKDLGDVKFILAIGRAKGKSLFELEVTSDRRAITEVVFDGEFGKNVEFLTLQSHGLDGLFNYVRFAPSYKNSQPWRYVLKDNEVVMYVEDLDKDPGKYIDAGIAMYYFEGLAKRVARNSQWKVIPEAERAKAGNFVELATYAL